MLKHTLTLKIDDENSTHYYKSILPELDKKNNRSKIRMEIVDNSNLLFEINASDYTAMLATINSILIKLRTMNELDF